MGKIGHGYGSEWHLLRYLGYHREYLQDSIIKVTGGTQIKWLDFQFSSVNQVLHQDREWQGIEFIDNPDVQERWAEFWPQTGNPPNWDAVGKIACNGGDEWLLVEAKDHLEEIHSTCGATNQKSREMIENAMHRAQDSFGCKVQISRWLSPYYQFCNRLSVLHFLMRECHPPIPTRLIFIYFYGDPYNGQKYPQVSEEWTPKIHEMYNAIGLVKESNLYLRVHQVFLSVSSCAASTSFYIDHIDHE
jgi:hypothetical protein